MGNQEKSPEF